MNKKVSRLIDANLNRSREGLRVIEDSLRFLGDDSEYTLKLRNLRHTIMQIPSLLGIPASQLLSSRDSEGDTGKLWEETVKGDYSQIISANFSRVEESLRVLEEYSRLVSAEATSQIKRIRFQIYTLQKEVSLLVYRNSLTERLGLYIITDEKIAGRSHTEIAKEAVAGGAEVIQLRDKEASARELYEVGTQMRKAIPPDKALFIVNDRVDVAAVVGADGVHVGKDDLPVREARNILGEDKIIGVSCDNAEEAVKAEKEGADYISLGPIFTTTTKKNLPPPLGLKAVKQVKSKISKPLVAIGGINKDNLKTVVESGADSVAVISAVLKAPDIAKATKELKNSFSQARKANERIGKRRGQSAGVKS